MTTSQPDQDPRGNASALNTVPGIPWWAAVVAAVVLTVVGFAIDLGRSNSVSVFAWALTLIGVIGAAVLIRRHAIFTAMVQPPLVVAAGLVLGYVFAIGGGVLNLGLKLVSTFPLMLVATGVALLIGIARILLQPLRFNTRARRTASSRTASHL